MYFDWSLRFRGEIIIVLYSALLIENFRTKNRCLVQRLRNSSSPLQSTSESYINFDQRYPICFLSCPLLVQYVAQFPHMGVWLFDLDISPCNFGKLGFTLQWVVSAWYHLYERVLELLRTSSLFTGAYV